MSILIYFIVFIALILIGGAIWTQSLARAALRAIPQAGKLYEVPGAMMHYVDSGPPDAPVLVLIHGLSGQLQHFTYGMVDLLNDDFRVIALDRPGCGYSTVNGGGGAPLADQARMIDDLLGGLGIKDAVLVGHSLGGAVALRMALDNPTRVKALALLCPLAVAQPEPADALKGFQVSSPWLRRLIGATIAIPMAKLTAGKLLAQVFHPDTYPDDFMTRAGAVLGFRASAFVTAASDMTGVAVDMPAQVARYQGALGVPGGILFGADDVVLDPQLHGQGMAKYRLTNEVLSGRGHMIPITAPQECANFVRRVVKEAG